MNLVIKVIKNRIKSPSLMASIERIVQKLKAVKSRSERLALRVGEALIRKRIEGSVSWWSQYLRKRSEDEAFLIYEGRMYLNTHPSFRLWSVRWLLGNY